MSNLMLCLNRIILNILLLCILSGGAYAAGGTGAYELAWKKSGEVLEYHSCGCADSCWVAEVKNRKTNILKARLRCDCERLYYSYGVAPEQQYAQSCAAFETGEKLKAIRETMELILRM
jgi:hypothetical protein